VRLRFPAPAAAERPSRPEPHWLAGFEDSVCAVVSGLVACKVAATRPGPRCVTFDLTKDHHAEMYFVLTQALEDFAVRERDEAAWEEGNSSRERWADLADAMRAQVEIELGANRRADST
jgi:hypothetical protein